MMWLDLVTVLAVLQFLAFGIRVAQARTRFQVKAPATSGHPQFERMYRVHMNTMELLVCLLPAVFLARDYWPPEYVALGVVVYLIGRQVYLHAYLSKPESRTLGFALSILPIVTMLLSVLVGALMQGLN